MPKRYEDKSNRLTESQTQILKHLQITACVLAVVKNAAMNRGVLISLKLVFSYSLDKYSEEEFLDRMVILFLNF